MTSRVVGLHDYIKSRPEIKGFCRQLDNRAFFLLNTNDQSVEMWALVPIGVIFKGEVMVSMSGRDYVHSVDMSYDEWDAWADESSTEFVFELPSPMPVSLPPSIEVPDCPPRQERITVGLSSILSHLEKMLDITDPALEDTFTESHLE